ncbi:hypothetical protein FACS1894198_7150 [Clostridia bacterium]|nr:hypothetical protein FACS1894198_7150 [Clostridia bacterium]
MKLKKTMSLIVASSMIATLFSAPSFGAGKSYPVSVLESATYIPVVGGELAPLSDAKTDLTGLALSGGESLMYAVQVDSS